MMFIRRQYDKHLLMAMKPNRKVSLSLEDKRQGRLQRIDTVNITENKLVNDWIAGVDFPLLLFRKVFKNKDGNAGVLYLVCSDLDCDGDTLKTIFQKRWKVKVFYKTLK